MRDDEPTLLNPEEWLPPEIGPITDHQTDLPRIALRPKLIKAIEARLAELPTQHTLRVCDARHMDFLQPNSVHLVLTSPPYWTLKQYRANPGQMGSIEDYDTFLSELDK